jgi:hypothetical protein
MGRRIRKTFRLFLLKLPCGGGESKRAKRRAAPPGEKVKERRVESRFNVQRVSRTNTPLCDPRLACSVIITTCRPFTPCISAAGVSSFLSTSLVLLQYTAYIDQGDPDVTAKLSVEGTTVVRSFGSLLKLNRLLPPTSDIQKHSFIPSLPLKSLLPNRNRRILFPAPPARDSFFYNQHHLAPYHNGIPLHCVSHPHGYSLRPSRSVPPSVFPRTAVHNLRLLMVTSQLMSPLCVVLPAAEPLPLCLP